MLNFKIGALAVALLAQAAAGSGCTPTSLTADDIQRQQQEVSDKQAVQQVGFPAITNFTEKRLLKHIFELRDEAVSTYTYTLDRDGHFHFLCDSIGYGIPYATQFTAPTAVQRYYLPATDTRGYEYGTESLPQADPNGLFSPAEAAGTWVDCLDPKSHKDVPLYVEPDVTVSPYKLPVTP